MGDFYRQKIVYSEIVREPQFYLDNDSSFFPEATSFIMTGENLEYLIAKLHSQLITYAFKNFYAGGGLGKGGYRYKKRFLENLPIMKFKNNQIQQQIIAIYRQRDKSNANEIDNKIDNLIYQLYGLTEEEIHLIEKDTIKFRG